MITFVEVPVENVKHNEWIIVGFKKTSKINLTRPISALLLYFVNWALEG